MEIFYSKLKFPGDLVYGAIPDPIPNSEVKAINADDSPSGRK